SVGNVGCPPATDQVVFQLSNNFLGLGITSTNALCNNTNNGTATVVGGENLSSFLWNDPGAQQTATASGLASGPYQVLISDLDGC
ncbi:MAG TPA: hypothetical protein PL070_20455, partial [Flavobacteriales bacterium]|nr:hypothetical protein [Flavobacteriales bacterium]